MTLKLRKLVTPQTSAPTALEPLTNYDLVQRVLRESDAAAFELIMRRHNQHLYRLARSILKNPTDAEDVVQETYVTAFQKLESFRGPGGFSAWLAKIALNFAYRRVRRRGRVVFFEDFVSPPNGEGDPLFSRIENIESSEPDPELNVQIAELRRLLEDAIDALPVEFRTVFILAKVDGQTIKEIAETLSLNEQTVKTRLFRAKKKLQETLGDAFDELVPSLHSFDGERCDRIVFRVLAKLTQ
ncbi:RNA polymerase sigma factor [Hyphococcus luteus]|uniref:RNA polymerase sigma factor n=1 Tax=Hyphococcus luteus TaxID=2058213 RepID=A0A2S7KBB4_9PROT|nr:RNA polymerase sigma factor [Marinicaulis flavus]PQA89748.1 RNA polymerase subunit sigma [Marinicaulis flavus]